MENLNKLTETSSSAPMTSDENKRKEAFKEYYFIEELIDRINERTITIKSWSITSCGAALGFGLAQKEPLLFCLASFGSIVFWYLEASWKFAQIEISDRLDELEHILSGNLNLYNGPKIAATFGKAFRDKFDTKDIVKVMLQTHIRIPHFFIFLIGILLFLVAMLRPYLPNLRAILNL